MKRAILFIDGFNMYHSISRNHLSIYKWLNYYNLGKSFLNKNRQLVDVYFFTALHNNENQKKRHNIYIEALKHYGVKTILGKFKYRDIFCLRCNEKFKRPEEKQTDVNLALSIYKHGAMDSYDTAMVLSADSDVIPAIKEVKSLSTKKEVIMLFPPYSRNISEFKKHCDKYYKLQEKHLRTYQLPNSITLSNNTVITKPPEWN